VVTARAIILRLPISPILFPYPTCVTCDARIWGNIKIWDGYAGTRRKPGKGETIGLIRVLAYEEPVAGSVEGAVAKLKKD
jgi:hypothetical protein